MNIKELQDIIYKERTKRAIANETLPSNAAKLREKVGGTFEAVVTGNGEEKCLVPQVGTLHFLYRGQNMEVAPCIPLKRRVSDTIFSDIEKKDIIEDWNTVSGKKFAEIIYRKRWFELDEFKEPDECYQEITGVRNEHNHRSLERIGFMQMIMMMANVEPLEGAEWINYKDTPRPKEKPRKDDGQVKEVPASMESLFGQPYLTEEDWIIKP